MNFYNHSYLVFCALTAGVMIAAKIVIAFLRNRPNSKSAAEIALVAYRPWVVMAPLILVIIGLGHQVTTLSLMILSLCCAKEFAKATGLYRDWHFMTTIYLGIVGIYVAIWFDSFGIFNAMPIYAVSLIFLLPILLNNAQGMVQKAALSVICIVYMGWFLAHLAFLNKFSNGTAYLLYVVFGTELSDISAFVSGKIFGQRRYFSNISPNKTIEGSLGALAVTVLYSLAIRPLLPEMHFSLLMLSTVVIWAGGSIGDLVISFIKRDVGIKDMGNLIPGHGGLLDRFDSLIFVAPLYFHLLKFFTAYPGQFL